MRIEEVCAKLQVPGICVACETIKTGNINNTYKVTFLQEDSLKDYIIQRINTYVFNNPEQVMSNISKITNHMRRKVQSEGLSAERKVLHFLHTEDVQYVFRDDEGNAWRGYEYIDNSVTYDVMDTLDKVYKTGKEFGEFQLRLSDFNAEELYDTIPDFHNTAKRLEKFFADVEKDEYHRVKDAREEIDFISKYRDLASDLSKKVEAGEIPIHVVHNDTKCNNILFDKYTHEPLAVIDLDTVMPGLVANDFGDAVRSITNTVREDEKDLTKVRFDMDRYDAFTRGFLEQTAKCLTKTELDTLALGAVSITIELASRFLDDYITGDKYFKTLYPGHNFDRARCQLKIAKDMILHFDEMNAIVAKYSK